MGIDVDDCNQNSGYCFLNSHPIYYLVLLSTPVAYGGRLIYCITVVAAVARFLRKPLGYYLLDRRFHKAYRNRFSILIAFTIVDDRLSVLPNVLFGKETQP